MHDRIDAHLHEHLHDIEERLCGMDSALERLAQLEIITSLKELKAMAKQSDEINKLGGKFDQLSGVVTDIHSDFEALRAAMEADRDSLSPDGQAALDAANAKADTLRQQLEDLNVEVGDADGSDIPVGGGGTTEPAPGGDTGTGQPAEGGVDEAPPAGEGTVVNPDEQGFGYTDAQPTA
jgi:outer membrane murein-binding lipoprotein Lpp